jgi:hypothetical protein
MPETNDTLENFFRELSQWEPINLEKTSTFEDVKDGLNEWIVEMMHSLGLCIGVASQVSGVNILSLNHIRHNYGDFRIRWYMSHCRIRMQFCMPTIISMQISFVDDPFIFKALSKSEKFDDYKKVEEEIGKHIPGLSVDRCYHCRSRLWLNDIDGRLVCDGCKPVENSDKPGYVYLYGSDEYELYKIGYSNNPATREQVFRPNMPFKCGIMHTFPATDGRKAEHATHQYFGKYRKHGEWFNLDSKHKTLFCSIERWEDGEFIVSDEVKA